MAFKDPWEGQVARLFLEVGEAYEAKKGKRKGRVLGNHGKYAPGMFQKKIVRKEV